MYATRYFKPNDLMDRPAMVASPSSADGWWLQNRNHLAQAESDAGIGDRPAHLGA